MAAVSAAAFIVLVVAVAIDSGPLPGDRRVLIELGDLVGDSHDDALTRLANLTDLGPLAIVAALVGLGLAWRRRWREFAYGGAVVGVVWAVNPVLKELFARSRPDLWPAPMPVSEHSFPSGHAANTVALAAAIVLVAWRTGARWPAVGIGSAVVVVVAAGQLALGVHYPSDILAGWLWAGAWAALVWSYGVSGPPAPSDPPPTRGSAGSSRS